MLFFLTDKSGPILNCFENHQHRGSDTEGDFDWEIRIEILKSGSSYFQSNTNSENKFRDGICNLKPRRGRIMDLFGNYFNSEVHNWRQCNYYETYELEKIAEQGIIHFHNESKIKSRGKSTIISSSSRHRERH